MLNFGPSALSFYKGADKGSSGIGEDEKCLRKKLGTDRSRRKS
jgi:hypothetical protein